MRRRPVVTALALGAVSALVLTGCFGGDSGKSDSGKSGSGKSGSGMSADSSKNGAGLVGPVIITPDMAKEGGKVAVPPITVGRTVVFNLGPIPSGGTVTLTTSNAMVFKVTGQGTNAVGASASYNAGGEAVGAGTAEVRATLKAPGVDNFLGTYTLVVTK